MPIKMPYGTLLGIEKTGCLIFMHLHSGQQCLRAEIFYVVIYVHRPNVAKFVC